MFMFWSFFFCFFKRNQLFSSFCGHIKLQNLPPCQNAVSRNVSFSIQAEIMVLVLTKVSLKYQYFRDKPSKPTRPSPSSFVQPSPKKCLTMKKNPKKNPQWNPQKLIPGISLFLKKKNNNPCFGVRGALRQLWLQVCRLSEPLSKAASYQLEVILINRHNTRPLIALLPHISGPSLGLGHVCGGLGSHRWAAVPRSPHSFDLPSLAASVLFFFPLPSLFPCLSSLNLSSSCCSVASPVLCSAVLITVPFSCQETEYDGDMWRSREHLQTRSEHQTVLYKYKYIKRMESLGI